MYSVIVSVWYIKTKNSYYNHLIYLLQEIFIKSKDLTIGRILYYICQFTAGVADHSADLVYTSHLNCTLIPNHSIHCKENNISEMSCNKFHNTLLNCNKTDGTHVQLNCTEVEPITNESIVLYMCAHTQNGPTPTNLPKNHSSSTVHPSSTPGGQPAGHSASNTNTHSKHTGKGNGAGSFTSSTVALTFALLLSLKPRAWVEFPKFSIY